MTNEDRYERLLVLMERLERYETERHKLVTAVNDVNSEAVIGGYDKDTRDDLQMMSYCPTVNDPIAQRARHRILERFKPAKPKPPVTLPGITPTSSVKLPGM